MAAVKQLHHYSDADWSNRLLNTIVAIQAAFIQQSDIRESFSLMLKSLLELTESEYGFLGEVLYNSDHQPYLITHALTDISWDEETKALYDRNMAKGFEFHNLNSLFGATLATGETVISNDPATDPRSGGLPHGHPGMKSYLGIPITHSDEMLGMLGIANRKGGYHNEIVDALKPLLFTAGSMINSVRDISVNRKIESELQEKHKLLDGIINNINDALIITDHKGIVKEVNKATEEIFGYHSQELVGRTISQCLASEHRVEYIENLKQFVLTGDRKIINGRVEVQGLTRKKKVLPMELTINDIKLGNKKLFVNTLQDISERKSQQNKLEKANKKLRQLSETDGLTGLYNRRYFDSSFLREFNRSKRSGNNMALAIIDIDHFKLYNDNYGHLQGDQCLGRVGSILKKYFRRDCEFSARIGGEEFAVVIAGMPQEECVAALDGLMLELEKESIEHEQSGEARLTLSVGLAMRDKSTRSTEDIYSRADRALYKAKKRGRNQLMLG